VCVCLSPHSHSTNPDVTWRSSGTRCPLVVQYWADLQSQHRFHCYDNIQVCKLIDLYTANSAGREMSASTCSYSLHAWLCVLFVVSKNFFCSLYQVIRLSSRKNVNHAISLFVSPFLYSFFSSSSTVTMTLTMLNKQGQQGSNQHLQLPFPMLSARMWINHRQSLQRIASATPDLRLPTHWHPGADCHRPMAGSNLYCLMTGGQGCEQLAESRYVAAPRPGVEPVTS